MPELPEVEIIRRGLEKYIVGSRIQDIEVLSSKQFIGDSRRVMGAKITGVRRFGKGLVIDLSNSFSIAIHVKMTGQLLYLGAEVNSVDLSRFRNKWTRAVFKIKDQRSKIKNRNQNLKKGLDSRLRGNDNKREGYSYLYFNDIRKFGWIRVAETRMVAGLPFFKMLGPEPLRDLDMRLFGKILASSKVPMKSVLMDQHKISGIGNIYANEALFLAKIYPLRPASSLTKTEAKRLLKAIEEILRRSIEAGGSSMTNYVNALGERGAYQEQFLVYGREGGKCSACKDYIKRIKTGGRGTFFCPKCQK